MSDTINNVKGQEIPIIHYRGDIFDEVWQIAKSDGTPYDMSGKTVILEIKKRKTDTDAEETISTTGGEISISGPDNDIVTFNKVVSLESEKTYFYDFTVVEDFYSPAYGTWQEIGDVSR